jgi:hypothetical protein
VTNVVSRIRLSPRYLRSVRTISPAGAMRQRPCSGPPSSAAKHAPESNRGQHSQSIEASLPISAPVSQSPMRA